MSNDRPIKTAVGILKDAERLQRSLNGNPRYQFTVDGVSMRTAPDSSLAYGDVPNNRDKPVIVTYRETYGFYTVQTVERLKA